MTLTVSQRKRKNFLIKLSQVKEVVALSRWIYESPDKGKTVYRYDADDPSADRELYRSASGLYHCPPDFDLKLTIDEDGIVTITL